MYTAAAKAHNQTAKRQVLGCFKKQRSHFGQTCPAGFGLQGTSCLPSSTASATDQFLRYFQQDYLGSISVITDQAGTFLGAVAGGVGSVIGGGKFSNGATTAAYGYLFNHLTLERSSINGEKFKLSNPNAMDELVKLNSAIVNLGYADDSFTIRITGGDRYADTNGVIRSATDDSIIKGSALNSRHLTSQGARSIDVSVSGVATADFQRVLATTNLSLLNVTYEDKHLLLDLPASKWFAPRRR